MIRNILSVLAGWLTAWILFTGIQLINFLIIPKPEGLVLSDPAMMKVMIDNMPSYGWVMLILSYVIGTFAAGFVIGKIAESKTIILPLIASILFMMGWLGNIMTFPHPLWIVILVFLIYIPSALAGHRVAVGKRSD